MLERAAQEFAQTGAEIIEADDAEAGREQAIDEVAADETGGTGDERFPV
jgi:ATP phosphoribosyltransferase regulatory subunit HisZ